MTSCSEHSSGFRSLLATDEVVIGLGSNLGDRRQNIVRACRELGRHMPVNVVSSLYSTTPVGYADQPDFLNAVLIGRWSGSPEDLLACMQEIERSGGRVRGDGPRFGPRTLDLDILLFGDCILESDILTIPHPRMYQRRFALDPMIEVRPDIRDPVSGRSFASFADELPAAGIYEYGSAPI